MSYSAQMLGWLSSDDGARFRDEPFRAPGSWAMPGGEDLDGHRSVEPRIAGAIHLAHAALAERCQTS